MSTLKQSTGTLLCLAFCLVIIVYFNTVRPQLPATPDTATTTTVTTHDSIAADHASNTATLHSTSTNARRTLAPASRRKTQPPASTSTDTTSTSSASSTTSTTSVATSNADSADCLQSNVYDYLRQQAAKKIFVGVITHKAGSTEALHKGIIETWGSRVQPLHFFSNGIDPVIQQAVDRQHSGIYFHDLQNPMGENYKYNYFKLMNFWKYAWENYMSVNPEMEWVVRLWNDNYVLVENFDAFLLKDVQRMYGAEADVASIGATSASSNPRTCAYPDELAHLTTVDAQALQWRKASGCLPDFNGPVALGNVDFFYQHRRNFDGNKWEVELGGDQEEAMRHMGQTEKSDGKGADPNRNKHRATERGPSVSSGSRKRMFLGGGPGTALNREALRLLYENSDVCFRYLRDHEMDMSCLWWCEDVMITQCLLMFGVQLVPSCGFFGHAPWKKYACSITDEQLLSHSDVPSRDCRLNGDRSSTSSSHTPERYDMSASPADVKAAVQGSIELYAKPGVPSTTLPKQLCTPKSWLPSNPLHPISTSTANPASPFWNPTNNEEISRLGTCPKTTHPPNIFHYMSADDMYRLDRLWYAGSR